jgi:anti-sigma regulatory factor (Ser/Thr protein kinase)
MRSHRLVLSPVIDDIPRLLDWAETCCGSAGVTIDVTGKMALALEEAAANVIHHAFPETPPPHRLEVTLAIDGERVVAEIVDNGRPFDPSTAAEADTTLPLEERDAGGLGIHLIRRMMDRVAYRRIDGENRLLLEKARA